MSYKRWINPTKLLKTLTAAVLTACLLGASITATAAGTVFKFSDYNYKDYVMPFSSSRLITVDDVRELYSNAIDLARNEIYARKGYIFKKQEYISYFSQMSWYKPKSTFNESQLSKIEKANVTFLQQYAAKIMKNLIQPGVKSTSADLNGDGKKDSIKLVCDADAYNFTLTVNGKSVSGQGDNLEGLFYICDINTADKLKEIAVVEMGPSDDYQTAFYSYDGKSLNFMGKISGGSYSLLLEGSGLLTTKTRGSILQTWFYADNYKLDAAHKLVHVPKSYYQMNTVVTMKKALTLQKSTTDKTVAFTLKPGEKAVIVATDNKKWCKMINSKGQTGWFHINGFYNMNDSEIAADQYFDGLIFAD